MRHRVVTAGFIAVIALCSLEAQARTTRQGARPVASGTFVKEPHLAASPISAAPQLTRTEVLAAVARYWGSMAQLTPAHVEFGLVNTHLTTVGMEKAWVVAYSVNMSPPSAGAQNAKVGPPNIRTMEFIVDDATDTVLEAIGYFD